MASVRTGRTKKKTRGAITVARPADPDSRPELALFTPEAITGGGRKKIGERYYQVEAVQAVVEGLVDGGRGQLRSACGTGKTVMAQRAAELLCPPGGVVVVLCPSIALIGQTLREWEVTNDDHVALAVCGDESVSDSVVTVEDLPTTVTTDPDLVATWLRTPTTAGLRLIVGTHRSAHVVGEGLQRAGLEAELVVIDEAHRAAGAADKHTALVHEDTRLPAKRRLYATATPKILGEAVIRRQRGGPRTKAKQMIGMDDESIFGRVLYSYPFSQAIEDGFLDNYRLVVMGVTRQEIIDHLAGLPREATTGFSETSLHTAMVQTVLAKAALEFGLRRVLTFCRRRNEAADFARSMKRTLSALPPSMVPDRHLTTAFVEGRHTAAEREQRLQLLVQPPRDGWTVVTNVKCLGEGVDVPAIDGVVFTYAKQSVSEIVQAVGRALRHDPEGTGTATIIVPILLPDEPGDLDQIDVADYRLLYQVVRALRAHDDKLGARIDRAEYSPAPGSERWRYEEQPLEHILVKLPDGYDDGTFLHHLTTKIITSARHPWWDGFAALQQFHARHGHTDFGNDHLSEDVTEEDGHPYRLGRWAERTRAVHRAGRLPQDRLDALDELGFDVHPHAVDWAIGLRAARDFHARHGHLEPVRSLRVDDVDLRAWLDKQRERAQSGELQPRRRAALDELGMRWHAEPETFDEHVAALTGYHGRHGDIDLAPDPDTPEGRLGRWLVGIRIQYKLGKLTQEQIASLDRLGMSWARRAPVSAAPPPD